MKEKLQQSVLMRQFGKPGEMTNIAVWFASGDASYVTGLPLSGDGSIMTGR